MPYLTWAKRLSLGTAFFAVSLFATIVPANAAAFPDTEGHRYEEAIDFLFERGIVAGYPDGTFGPDNTLNRAELLTIIMGSRFENLPAKSCFTDIGRRKWFAPYVCKALELGYISGYPDGKYRPGQDANLVEALIIMQRAFDIDVNTTDGPYWFEESVRTASGMNIIPNDGLHFAMYITRGQMAEMMTRMIKFQEGTLDEYLNGTDDIATFEDLEEETTDANDESQTGGSGGVSIPSDDGSGTNSGGDTTNNDTEETPSTNLPDANAADITVLEVKNDQAIGRNELAFSGVPIAKSRNLLSTDNLYISNADGNKIDAQFKVLSRWGGGPSESSKPIRWVEVSFVANVPANATGYYSLRNASNPPGAANLVQGQGTSLIVQTGPSTFVLDGTKVGIFDSINVNGRTVYSDSAAAGPRLVDGGQTVTARVDANGFVVEQNGPVKAVIRSSGHFAQSTSSCNIPLAYDMRLTFVRGTPNVGMEFDIRNECGDGYNLDWQGNRHVIDEVRWDLPLALASSSRKSIVANDNNVYSSSAGFSGITEIEQRVGTTGSAGWRRAHITRGGSTLNSASAYTKPFLALSDNNFSAGITMPWMQWREPQALAANDSTLQIKFISEENGVGEAQARWNFAQLRFFEGAASDASIQRERDLAVAGTERGLLVHAPVDYMNATQVMPPLPTATSGPLLNAYKAAIESTHNSTVDEQWRDNKTVGIFWPDIPLFSSQNSTPNDFSLTSNYWSPTSSELLEFFRTGDPKWYWDFAFPAEQTFLKTAVYNTGGEYVPGDIRSGFGVGKGEVSPYGSAYRNNQSSDDYFYNQGSDEFYVVRPSKSIQDVFKRSCQTFIERYNEPRNQGGQWVSKMEITRQVSQHVNALRYGAEFVEDQNQSADCNKKLYEVFQEFAEDNFANGIFCINDSGNAGSCETDDSFMYTAMFLDMAYGYLFNYGDHGGAIQRAIVTTADQSYQHMLPRSGDTINIGGDWFNALRCSFGSPSPSCSGIRYDEPLYDHARPMLLASFLIANNFDAQPGRCGAVAEALGQSMGGEFSDFMFNGLGWSKGSSQVMHLMAHGAAIGDSCWNGGTAPVAPVIEDAILSDAGSSDSGTTEASPSQIEDETPPADETAPPPAAASGLPTSTYSLASGEVVDIYQGEGDYHMVMSHTIGSGTCFGSDWVLYDWYLAPSGGDFTQIGSTTEAESLDVNGHFLESQGCNKGTFLMSFNLPAGTHQGGVCITNRNNTQQRYCTSMPFTL